MTTIFCVEPRVGSDEVPGDPTMLGWRCKALVNGKLLDQRYTADTITDALMLMRAHASGDRSVPSDRAA